MGNLLKMSLAWTAPAKTDMYEFMYEKVWYKFEDKTTLWDAWGAANTSETARIAKYSGRALTVKVSNAFIAGWPTDPAYVTKWSGGCLRDESSGVGGFCLLENADLDLTVTSTTATTIYGVSGSTTTVQNMTNRAM